MRAEEGAQLSSLYVLVQCFKLTAMSTRSVVLAKKKTTGDIFAIKVLKKKSIMEKNQRDFIKNERDILSFTNNPFVVKLYYSFQSAVRSSAFNTFLFAICCICGISHHLCSLRITCTW